jgi:L-fuconolactonase
MRIDTHVHFWHYNPAEHIWMTDEMDALRRTFLPADLQPLLAATGFDGAVAVQARQLLAETEWLLELADQHPLVRGVVGWVDLQAPEVMDQLERFSGHPAFKGVRHVVHDEPDDEFMLRRAFQRGIAALKPFELPYDLLLYPRHLPVALALVRAFPDQLFVLDHIAKPPIREGRLSPWREELHRLARCENVLCKLSGMDTEAAWGRWTAAEFEPYLDVVLEAFGPRRLMLGSNWPVCTLSSSYAAAVGIATDYIARLSPDEQAQIYGATAARCYKLPAETSA